MFVVRQKAKFYNSAIKGWIYLDLLNGVEVKN